MSARIPESADVVIVGGGIMGTSTAFHLARDTDLEILLLEKDSIGSGSTGRSSGNIRFNYGPVRHYSEMAYESYKFWTATEEKLGSDVGFKQNGMIYFGRDDEDYGEKAGVEILSDLGVDVELLSVHECEELVPHVSAEDYDYGIYSKDAGFADPYAANMAFYQNAMELGVRVETGIEVTELRTDDSGKTTVTGVKTRAGTIEAETVVCAAGPWSKQLASSAGVTLPITPTREQSLILSVGDDFQTQYPYPFPTISSKAPGHVYFRPNPVDNILVSGHQRGTECNPDTYKEKADFEYIDWVIEKLETRSPPLAEAKLVRGYAGVYSNTPDKDFIIDKPVEGLVCLAGFSGHGFKHSPVIGAIASDLVTRGETDIVDVEPFSLSRFEQRGTETRDSL
ncbi:MAG: NAD(P)/FAD-dependent oxidoreductase [Haloarculaceae archaeon]